MSHHGPFASHWTRRLTDGFPMLAAMQVRVEGHEHAWFLAAPFDPNRNDHGTAFGGSLSTLTTIAGWMRTNLAAGDDHDVVIQHGNCDFVRPLTGDLFARPLPVDDLTLQRFSSALARRGRARLAVQVEILNDACEQVVLFSGQYVATKLA